MSTTTKSAATESGTAVEHVRVAVIGAGFAGVAAAVAIKGDGIDDFVLLERAGDVGGVWRENTYPGVACDVPSHLYSLSYAPNAEWSRTFSEGAQICDYVRQVAAEHGVLSHVRFGQAVLDASWDDDRQRWTITTTELTLTADVLVDCAGPLSEPQVPGISGIERFQGKIFHSAQWDHEHELTGERVAVVGTGASAIQFVPRIQPKVGHLTVFQRTPGWVIPRMDRETTAFERRVLRAVPGLARLQRLLQFAVRDLLHFPMIRRQRLARIVMTALAKRHLRKQVPDPELRAKLTPDFEIGCKRILITNEWYPALSQPNVEVVASGVREIRERSIVAADGSEHEVDTIILGTGFHVAMPPIAKRIHGRGGRSLADVWVDGPRHYRAMAVAGFPNYVRLCGVGCGLGHGSMVFMAESQTAYLRNVLRTLAQRGLATIEVTQQAQDAYMAQTRRDLGQTVWALGGCSSWYQDSSGEATGMWPKTMGAYRRLTRQFDLADHDLRARVAA